MILLLFFHVEGHLKWILSIITEHTTISFPSGNIFQCKLVGYLPFFLPNTGLIFALAVKAYEIPCLTIDSTIVLGNESVNWLVASGVIVKSWLTVNTFVEPLYAVTILASPASVPFEIVKMAPTYASVTDENLPPSAAIVNVVADADAVLPINVFAFISLTWKLKI